MPSNPSPPRRSRLATATTWLAVTSMLVLALTAHTSETAAQRWHARRDSGEILDFVVIAAGVVTLAIAVIARIRPVVMRYLSQIV